MPWAFLGVERDMLLMFLLVMDRRELNAVVGNVAMGAA